MPAEEVITATERDADRCVALIVLAFANDPAARWLYPEGPAFLAHFPQFVRAFGGAAFEHGSAYMVGTAAAALWLPPGAESDEDALMALMEKTVPASHRDDVFAVLDRMGRWHPQEPHWYLPLIGTDPVRQGRGYGSALLADALAECDRQKLPAYLEATNPRNVRLYQRHGFQVLGTIQEGSSPEITPMLRHPR